MSVANPSHEMPPATERPSEADFEAIYDAVMATDRGRWFLFEYARRNRNTDTALVLEAIDRLMTLARADAEAREVAAAEKSGPDTDRLQSELVDMANAVARTRVEMAAIKPDGGEHGDADESAEPLEALVRSTERTTADILFAAGQIQEMAWAMREQGMDTQCCDLLDGRAAAIYTACSLDVLNRQRTRKVIHVQRYLEARIQAMIALWRENQPDGQIVPGPDQLGHRNAPEITSSEVIVSQPVTDPPIAIVATEEAAVADATPAPSSEAADDEVTPAPIAEAAKVEAMPLPPVQLPRDTAPVTHTAPVEHDADWVIADLRALARNMARYDAPAAGAKPLPSELPVPAVSVAAEAKAQSMPAAEAVARPATADPTPATEEPARQEPTTSAAAPAPNEPPPPAPTKRRRATTIAEEFFADVMALGSDERTALFS